MTGKVVLGGVLAVIALYGALWALNARDQAPSAQVQGFHAERARRPVLADADNAFVYLSGMGAAKGEDPQQVGAAHIKRLAGAARQETLALPGGAPALRKARSPAVQQLASICSQDAKACAEALPTSDATLTQWLASEGWWLERYHALIQHAGWRDADAADIALVFPPYQHALDGQQLLLLQAWQRAHAGDAAAAQALLDSDLLFWRRVLRESDLLVSKSIAAAAIRRHFALGNLVLREQAIAPPAGWAVPFTVQERSMRRALAGELRLVEGATDSALASAAPAQTGLERVIYALQAPFFKRQATINLIAADYEVLAAVSERPLPELPDALAQAQKNTATVGPGWLYNPTGHLLQQVGSGTLRYGDYLFQFADLEGLRRTAWTTADLRTRGQDRAGMTAVLTAAPLRDPYGGEPLRWSAAQDAVVFDARAKRFGPSRLWVIY
ncbi:hypothetical protein P6166_14425 [Stenotrophomonas sp. HITSZ_GD]|uniref:hypothetical protein n=1 Tax=Stenotrophomonas sp. HITSZ_GD TaxID=3037248 RepID=UPI00240D528E|nr:hypothetical protein [Stenotrophomonas sp. HITSZ_GD]MDG2526549.1 hypothetical protein [Stenotrophomonas sp. HITSZ_GD]